MEYLTYDEGFCVQCMHLGSYDDEPETLARMDAFAAEQGYAVDFSDTRFHHEIYLSDPNRTLPEKRKFSFPALVCSNSPSSGGTTKSK